MSEQLECRVVVTNHGDGRTFDLGMYDPLTGRYEFLGTHPVRDRERRVRDLQRTIEGAGHRLSLCERSAG